MEEKGRSEKEVLKLLSDARKKDWKYSNGKILSSMCTSPHPFAKEVYSLFSDTNMGDAGLFKGTKELENKAIKMLGALLGHPDAAGFIVSGGTEANIMALWIARNLKRVESPEIIVPKTAHFSIEKAADLLGLKMVKAECVRHCVNVSDVAAKVNENTVAIVGIAGTTEYGTIDDIEGLSEIATMENLFLHVDSAFGGLVIPFLKELGYDVEKFDFSLNGVTSITVDPHKMGLVAIPSGCILLRDAALLKSIETVSPYLIEKRQHTVVGTRPGASVAVTYAVLKHMGRRGYRDVVKKCMYKTLRLYEGLKKAGMDTVAPTMNVLVFSHEAQEEISGKLIEKGWIISRTGAGEIRLVIMPHFKDEMVGGFIKDLEGILEGL